MTNADLPAIGHLPVEAKRRLLVMLARELLPPSGAPLSVADAAGGEVMVYAVPPDARARAERAMWEADAARLAELRRRAATPERSFSLDEAIGAPDTPADQSR